MRRILRYKIYEKSLADAKKELKNFQEELDIDITIKDLVDSIDGIELEIESVFSFLKNNEKLENLIDNSTFKTELEERDLKPSELFNSEDFNTFTKLPIKWIWRYEKDASDMEIPIYIIIQYFKNNEWSLLKMFYVQQEIDNFLEELSEITLEIRQKNGDKKWIYTTSNSGEDWILQNIENVTSTFTKNLDWDKIIMLSKHSKVELVFY